MLVNILSISFAAVSCHRVSVLVISMFFWAVLVNICEAASKYLYEIVYKAMAFDVHSNAIPTIAFAN